MNFGINKQFKTVKEVAKMTGTTVRALHYYDEINLLKSSNISQAGYRLYSNEDIETLQQIMFFKEIGLELKQIKNIIHNSEFDKREALRKHKEILILKKNRIESLIKLVDYQLEEGSKISFSEFDESYIIAKQKEYHDEVVQRWSNTKYYQEFEEKKYKYNNEINDIDKEISIIFREIAGYMKSPPSCKEVQNLISLWQDYITENYYSCTSEMLQYLALMYVEDERFKNYINSISDDLAPYISEAIKFYCETNNKKS